MEIIKEENVENINILLVSSLFFITNVATAYFNEYYLYSGLFALLTITSLTYHSNKNNYTYIIDKTAIILIVAYGAYMLYNKFNSDIFLNFIMILSTLLACVYLYYYGYITSQYCFCDDDCISQKYHFILHVIVSIGHHLIIFL
jgi:hypothetical protein